MKSQICHTIKKNLHNDLFCYYRKRGRHLSHCTLCFEKCFQDHGKTARFRQNHKALLTSTHKATTYVFMEEQKIILEVLSNTPP